MATEKRLIDVCAEIRKIEEVLAERKEQSGSFTYKVFEAVKIALEKAPTVDAVEVIRCKDCKWYNRDEFIMPQSGSCEFHETVKMDWDFCSRAKMDGDGNA